MAEYLYTDSNNKPNNDIMNIDIINTDIIKKSFCYKPDDDTELDDLLTQREFVDDAWVKTIEVTCGYRYENYTNNAKQVPNKYIHYKRIW
jgi:hypothetical protein